MEMKRVGQWPVWGKPKSREPDASHVAILGHEMLTGKELRKYKNIAGHYGTLMRHRVGSVRNALRNQGCPDPEATWIARAATGKRTT